MHPVRSEPQNREAERSSNGRDAMGAVVRALKSSKFVQTEKGSRSDVEKILVPYPDAIVTVSKEAEEAAKTEGKEKQRTKQLQARSSVP